ncbi:shikimate kinase [Thermosulfurimonas marina]|uniref:Shikimate kinase n=1 Tax=Thermosulfurimonas marina TaxID=2047767 RepID=A0A6H1WQ82_9BACT|nr:shikimate kinase [Thermosulfurimonas marina]QJA05318.1 shikimate kinase [Thermosulfurimonas marina]
MWLQKVILIGFRATGKSTVGRLLAERLSWDFVDLDHYIERRLGKSIREVVEEEGWETFRRAEREALRDFIGRPRVVLAVGGGAVMHRKEMEELGREGLFIWLKASPETISQRLKKDPYTKTRRPSLTGKSLEEEVRELLQERTPLYSALAHLELSSETQAPEELVEHILEQIKNF